MKYVVAILVIVAIGFGFFWVSGSGGARPAPAIAVATPRERMEALAKSMDVELLAFSEASNGNVTFAVRIAESNPRTAGDFLDAARREGIVADAAETSSAFATDDDGETATDTHFRGSLRK